MSPTRTSSKRPSRRLDHRADRHHRPVLAAAVELLIAVAVAVERREADLGQHLLGLDRRLQVVLEQVGGGHRALPARALEGDLAVGDEHRRRQVGGRVAVGQASRRSCPGCAPGGRRSSPATVETTPSSGVFSSTACGVSAPIRQWPFWRSTPCRPGSLRRSTSSAGAASRSFISGISEWPPASSLASSPFSCSSRMASSSVSGAAVVERGRDHAAPPLASVIASQTRIGLSGMLM